MDWEQCCSIPDDSSLARVDANSALTRPLEPDRYGGTAEAGLSCMALNATVHAVEGRSAGARLGLGLSSLAGWLALQLTGAGPACSHIPIAKRMVGSSTGYLGLPSAGLLSFLLKLQGAQVPTSSAPPLALPASWLSVKELLGLMEVEGLKQALVSGTQGAQQEGVDVDIAIMIMLLSVHKFTHCNVH